MVKSVWVKADKGSWDERKARITAALELGADAVLVNEEDVRKVRELGKIRVAAFIRESGSEADVPVVGRGSEGDGTQPLPPDLSKSHDLSLLRGLGKNAGAYVEIRSKGHERLAAELARVSKTLLVVGADWKIIPLENLIAELQPLGTEIVMGARDSTEARVAFETLETGAHGVLLDTADRFEIQKTVALARGGSARLPLVAARVTRLRQVGMGDRVCVDTCSVLNPGEGMLIGSQSNGFFLIHAEVEESAYVAARPFRVNAGPVHAYILTGEKTRYLSELGAGDEVLVVSAKGDATRSVVGRVKIERRPLVLVEAEAQGQTLKTLVQNAETIKLVRPDGKAVPITQLKEGDDVLVHLMAGGRHFGMKVEETIIEK
ncbi:MAG: 3-dehydroquinate synthase II [Euryarchaeota archaeon]|nr:3-dehydroquinate synthase II [Euryarchaeota archaeon]